MVGTVQSYNPYSSMFPTTWVANTDTPVSPQMPQNQTLDYVELGVKSLIVGKLASGSAVKHLEFTSLQQNQLNTVGLMASTGFRTMRSGALVGGGISLARNIYHMAKSEINVARAGGNVAADMLGGAVSGLVAGAGSGLTVGLLSKSSSFAMGTAGLIVGAAGFALMDTLYRQTGFREKVSDTVAGVIDRIFDKQEDPGGV